MFSQKLPGYVTFLIALPCRVLAILQVRPSMAQFLCSVLARSLLPYRWILCHTLPPGCTHCQPELADLLSHSFRVVNIGHTPVPAVSACKPTSLWVSPDAFFSPQTTKEPLPHLSISTQGLNCAMMAQSSKHSEANQTQKILWAFFFLT